MKKILSIVLSMIVFISAQAAEVDTITVFSKSMNKDIAVSVIRPSEIVDNTELPTVYLLHGYGDNNLRGYLSLTDVTDYADELDLFIVIPDGDTSWYFDSPVDPTYKYETFVTKELVEYIDNNYPTVTNRNGRAITGLSMGGHGALYLAMRHQDIFGAAGSMSGGVDFTPFPNNWDLKKRLGSFDKHPENWKKNTVVAQLDKVKPNALSIIVDCGTEDFFYQVNLKLHDEMTKRNIPHEFTTRPGKHNWDYWRRSLRDHILFFNDFFLLSEGDIPEE